MKYISAILTTVVMAVFNALFFLLGGVEHPTSVWIAYAAIHCAYAVVCLVPLFVKKDKNAMVNAAPLTAVSLIHFGIQLVFGSIMILIAPESHTFLLVVEIILWGAFLAVFFTVLAANIHTTAAETKQKSEVRYVRHQASRVKVLMGRYVGGKLDRKIEKAYDLMFTSPTRSDVDTETLEWDISTKIDSLERELKAGNVYEANRILDELMVLVERVNYAIQTGTEPDSLDAMSRKP